MKTEEQEKIKVQSDKILSEVLRSLESGIVSDAPLLTVQLLAVVAAELKGLNTSLHEISSIRNEAGEISEGLSDINKTLADIYEDGIG